MRQARAASPFLQRGLPLGKQRELFLTDFRRQRSFRRTFNIQPAFANYGVAGAQRSTPNLKIGFKPFTADGPLSFRVKHGPACSPSPETAEGRLTSSRHALESELH